MALLAQEIDYPGIPNSRFNKRISMTCEGHEIMIRGKRRGDVDVSVRIANLALWTFVFKHNVTTKRICDMDLAEKIVLPAMRKVMVLADLADV